MKAFLFALAVSGLIVSAPLSVNAAEKKPAVAGQAPAVQTTVKDPVCGMDVETAKAKFVHEYKGKKYYFCSKEDMDKFKAGPGRYIKK